MWLCECPTDDQGLVRPLVTSSGTVVLLCDDGGEVWLEPGDVSVTEPFIPSAPDFTVHGDVHIRFDTTRWADWDDLPREWRELDWHPGPD